MGGLRARTAALIGVVAALIVAVLWAYRARDPRSRPLPLVETTRAVRVVRHDASGMARSETVVREPERVRAIVDALGLDAPNSRQETVACPPDYSDAELTLILSGGDVYAKRSVYLYGFVAEAGAAPDREGGSPIVLSTSSAGCRRGPPADADALRRETTRDDARRDR